MIELPEGAVLKPCPFCGKEAKVHGANFIHCEDVVNCCAQVELGDHGGRTEEFTVESWNRRPPIVRDRFGKDVCVGDRVMLHDYRGEDTPIEGVLKYDPAFWAYAVRSDEGRYLLSDNLRTCIDPGDGGFAWEEIELIEG